MRNLNIVIIAFFCCSALVSGQTIDTIQKNHEQFFTKLAANGGIWTAENPAYDAAKDDDFKEFILKVKQEDALKINAEIQGGNTKGDTLDFWTFSEFYAPHVKKNIFYQRSIDGQYYAVGEATMTPNERYCEMSFYYVGGEYQKHKDTHTFSSKDTMKSLSYDFDPEASEWKLVSTFTWIRKAA